ncbi:MAG: monovalent cation/H+ antiporter complex subunit F [Thiohalorhabdus sp.]|uniref:monovalent cation/H+ antiporter complex subunit F n=1 Tax=Thiohalorhabdus sp. TaxID=3094134 RepID=UPI002FC337EB
MSTAFGVIALLILVAVVAGLVRVAFGREPVERMMAAQLLGTGGVGMVVALAAAARAPGLVDVALVFAGLAAVAAVAFVHRIWRTGEGMADD